ncbi:uncharacterized protein K489DRAFT_228268 [Dissoconium aciculare CBS 342.82]|uniref:Uncharacterized protein n=1 Tax=Dissoconium aciculare CBS 342.82 TaxID=1314786 RepID=A0A6J3M1L7_9PEZI|nr:uncharacterized protein K489DRAFT_228268 [Dissoconium aciculare CBS 342.82]KAF1821911.1 hypothetical protein K489DRAFT_228268 [Dissoconium aciculare CBS 342.82]
MLHMRELVGRGLSSSRIAQSTIREVRNPVVAILQAARTRESGVPRDKIFSMLEIYRICAGTELPLVEPDYHRSCEAIMIEAAENIILHQNNLDILSCAADHRHRRDRILPSWVPDWREQLCPEMHFNGYSLGSAIAKTEHTFCKIRDDHRLLESWGYILNKIDRAIRIDISDREAFANSVLASAKMVSDPSAHDNYGTKAFWLSILFFLDARMFDIYQWSFGGQCDPTEAHGEDALPDGDVRKLESLSAPQFPPRSRDAAVELTDVLWKYFYSEKFPQWIYDGSNIFLTRMGSCVVAPKTAKSGDEIVLFPNTAYMFTLRRIFEYHHVTGPW